MKSFLAKDIEWVVSRKAAAALNIVIPAKGTKNRKPSVI
jgi:hypothetical protein